MLRYAMTGVGHARDCTTPLEAAEVIARLGFLLEYKEVHRSPSVIFRRQASLPVSNGVPPR